MKGLLSVVLGETRLLRILLIATALAVLLCPAYAEDAAKPAPCPIRDFFREAVGEWVGICKQSTDEEPTDDKYFHAAIRETDPTKFEAKFEYFRVDAAGILVRIGSSSVAATISSDCTATTSVTGTGEMLVDKKTKKQEHALTENLIATGQGSIEARGTGTLKVYGMPLGLGKLGKVRDDQSSWSLSKGTLSIHQNLSIVFRALCFSKAFKVDATYNAVRGSDVASVVPKQPPGLSKCGG